MGKRNKQDVSADDIIRQMYPDLQTSDDLEAAEVAKKTAAGGQDDAAKQIADLNAKIARLEGAQSVAQRPVPVVTQMVAPQRPNIDWSKAPDPINEPKEYGKFLTESNQAIIDYEKQAWQYQSSQQQLVANRTQNLWSQFETNYKDYTENTDRVEIAASRVIQRLQASGVDTDNYMYGQSDRFMKDVVSEIDKLWGKPDAADGDDNDDGEDDDNRTAVFGGSGAGPKGPAKVQDQPQKYGSLSTDIMAWQEKTGFYR